MTQLPPPDPAEGAAAEAQAAEARASALAELTAGSLTLAELFAQVDAEEPKHQLGHIHVHAALLALPHIGEVRAGQLLDDIGVPYSRHLAALGDAQQRWLVTETGSDRGAAAERSLGT